MHRIATALLLATSTAAMGSTTVLYDGPSNTAPETQGWLDYFGISLSSSPIIRNTVSGKTTLDTTANNDIRAGYSTHTVATTLVNPAFPELDRAIGFVVRLDARVIAESHASNDRAGLSLIALGSDKKGVELGFWTDRIWAQEGGTAPGLFTQAEGVSLDTTVARRYELTIDPSTYTLAADGITVLTGPVRDYTAWVPPPLFPDPYEIPNYLFLGDNTTSARASFEFSHLSVVIPEPTSLIPVVGFALLLKRRRRGR